MPMIPDLPIITDPRCQLYAAPGHPERPDRIRRTVNLLRGQDRLTIEWVRPQPVSDQVLLRAHTGPHLKRLEREVDFDLDTPSYAGISEHARRSVGGALRGLRFALGGRRAFSLLRPPGHHATRSEAMGFCYLNSVAIAALTAQAAGVGRVAVFDFDVHHGNGTEDILSGRSGFSYHSIHQFPAYPGTGRNHRDGNCYNYPVPAGLPAGDYRSVATEVLAEMVGLKPDLLIVSAGFDAYARDPLCQQRLEAEDYHWLGKTLSGLGLPYFSVLEGGYSDDLPGLILAYLRGMAGLELQQAASATALASGSDSNENILWSLDDLGS